MEGGSRFKGVAQGTRTGERGGGVIGGEGYSLTRSD